MHTYLTTIEGKGYIEVGKKGRNLIMKPFISEEEHKQEQTERMVDFWYDGSKHGLIKTLVDGEISEESGEHLMNVLDELDEL
ncbi:BlaI/MecI/CopY family transcriptional regulator [Anaerostipes sp. PC18]|uniref:BlaI/MecI/CopY family transcriptional regulator n=1 Tax=Anaerostipes sp. PC18 TaxID=3036926 RepID=UPI0032206F58